MNDVMNNMMVIKRKVVCFNVEVRAKVVIDDHEEAKIGNNRILIVSVKISQRNHFDEDNAIEFCEEFDADEVAFEEKAVMEVAHKIVADYVAQMFA